VTTTPQATPKDDLPTKDFSELSCAIVCLRKWYARHWLNLVPLQASAAPNFGIWIHKALDEMYKNDWSIDAALEQWAKAQLLPDEKRTSAIGELILKAYHLEYVSQRMEVLHNEVQWFLPVSRRGWDFTLHGRIDRIVRRRDQIWCMDHKTTTRLGATYFEQFHPNLQVAFYTKAGFAYFDDIAGMIMDAIFVGKNRNFARDYVVLPKGELELQFAEGLEHAVEVLEMEKALKERPEEWRTICRRSMISEACSSWSGCEYRDLCRWDFAEPIIEAEFKVEPWLP